MCYGIFATRSAAGCNFLYRYCHPGSYPIPQQPDNAPYLYRRCIRVVRGIPFDDHPGTSNQLFSSVDDDQKCCIFDHHHRPGTVLPKTNGEEKRITSDNHFFQLIELFILKAFIYQPNPKDNKNP